MASSCAVRKIRMAISCHFVCQAHERQSRHDEALVTHTSVGHHELLERAASAFAHSPDAINRRGQSMSSVRPWCSRRAVKVAIYEHALRNTLWSLSRLWLRDCHLELQDVCKVGGRTKREGEEREGEISWLLSPRARTSEQSDTGSGGPALPSVSLAAAGGSKAAADGAPFSSTCLVTGPPPSRTRLAS